MPLTDYQKEYLINCSHRWNVKTGATGSGKSFVDYAYVIPKRIIACRGEGLIVMLGNTRGTLERNILEPMREIWGADLVGEIKSNNTARIFGKKVYTLGTDNKKHISRIQGATIEYAYGDEVTTWTQGVFEMLKSRLRCEHSIFDGTCNPDAPTHWFKRFLDSDADIYQQSYTIDDGCLPPQVVEELKKEYAGSVFYNRFILGQWCAAEGLVYDMFDLDRHVVSEVATAGEMYVSCDFGVQNATVFLLWQRDSEGRWIAIDEWYYSGRENRHQISTHQMVEGLDSMLDGRVPLKVFVDPSAAALIVELRNAGYQVKKADNDVINGIAEVGSCLQRGMIAFDKKCKNAIREAQTYAWDSTASMNGQDRPIKENDHAMDATRYFVKTMRLVKRSKQIEGPFDDGYMGLGGTYF